MLKHKKNTMQKQSVETSVPMQATATQDQTVEERDTAQQLLQRAPRSYLFNQVYNIWFYISSFLFTIILTRAVKADQYGVYAIIQTTLNTIMYLIAFGLEDATSVYIPRMLAEYGLAAAAKLTRFILGVRLLFLVISIGILLFGLHWLALGISMLPIHGTQAIVQVLQNPILVQYNLPIVLYLFGTGIGNALTALCAAQMRMQIVLVVNGITQLVLLLLSFLLLTQGKGITGILWLQAAIALANALAFALWQTPYLWKRPSGVQLPLAGVLKLSFSAWLTNLASGALLKQISITLLGIFMVSYVSIGYFNLSFQLADSANVLLVAGFSGVGGSALAAAFVGNNAERLGKTWLTLIKVETLIAAPGLVFCLFNASTIAHILYGSAYDPVGPLLAIFLFFNLIVRILGTTIHQASLYVVGKARAVVIGQWTGILVMIGCAIILIPRLGAAGALIADGIAKTITGILLLIFIIRSIPRHQSRELLNFTVRVMLALALAALPTLLWHPNDRLLLGVSGGIFLILCLGLLLLIKPLSSADTQMIQATRPRIARLLKLFTRQRS
ncbi:lipopolysaccharide biosynthesis protein [Dictyobacter arantiisoli]|uniref:Uncharacterized protein n=1 Tax=Dictyobacter arantiisoli TaxID=2014874 RepID=A0A5A5TE12_9CHLR|nr:polysaccharide biosynthesis C-terminal domain-containing protein [Dictyobacter arantiisoli]GCF09134.1 hypothetical protein KDI_26980 [Dictyobacter arantiisoli]